MYILAWSIDLGNNTLEDTYILCEGEKDARMELERVKAVHDNLYCWAITAVIDASEPHWMD